MSLLQMLTNDDINDEVNFTLNQFGQGKSGRVRLSADSGIHKVCN